jgi:hypothetical protein
MGKQQDDLKMADLRLLKYLMSLGLGLKWGKPELKISAGFLFNSKQHSIKLY